LRKLTKRGHRIHGIDDILSKWLIYNELDICESILESQIIWGF